MVLRIGALTDSSLRVRRIGLARRVTVASPDYIMRHGRPERPEDLAGHDCALYTRLASGPEWRFKTENGEVAVRVGGRIRADNSAAMLGAVVAGLGIGLAPLWLVGADLNTGRLVRLLEDFEPAPLPIHAVSPPRRFMPPKVRAFVDYIADEFRREPDLSGASS